MLGGLVKELFCALGEYFRFRSSRMLGRPTPAVAQATLAAPQATPTVLQDPSPGIASPEQIAALSNAVGLDESYLVSQTWESDRHDESELGLETNPVFQLWKTVPEGFKWTHYFETYEALFGPYRSRAMRVLEIGVFRGNSLRLWRKYFHHPESLVVGIDIEPDCARFDAPAERMHVRIGSQADPEFLGRVAEEFGPFDLIIDDGSHHSTHMIASFNALYRSALKDGGIYFVEDLHANYWFPWRDSRRAFLDLCKELLELMQAHYTQAWLNDWHGESQGAPLKVVVPEITRMIKEVRVFDSMVAIYKTHRRHLPRWIEH